MKEKIRNLNFTVQSLSEEKFYVLSQIVSLAALLRDEQIRRLQGDPEYCAWNEVSKEARLVAAIKEYLLIQN